MNHKETMDFFSDLSNEEKAAFLCRLAFELTISARDTYEVGTEDLENPKLMRSINEIQHRILSYASQLQRGETSGENSAEHAAVFWQVVFDANDKDLHKMLEKAVSHVLTSFAPVLI